MNLEPPVATFKESAEDLNAPPRCSKCGGPLGSCATCGMPAQCGEAFCAQHTDPPNWSAPVGALPDQAGSREKDEQ